jgi:hypothetical protein
MHARFGLLSVALVSSLLFACSAADEADAGEASSSDVVSSSELEAKPQAYGRFGQHLAATDRFAVVGAPQHNVTPGMSNQGGGCAYVFERVERGWGPAVSLCEAVKQARPEEAFAGFGAAVAVSEDTIVVAAPERIVGAKGSAQPGKLFVFERGTTWSLTQVLEIALSRTASLALTPRTVVLGLSERAEGGTVFTFARDASGTVRAEGASELPPGDCTRDLGDTVALTTLGGKEVLAVGQTFQCATQLEQEESRNGRVRLFERGEGTTAWKELEASPWMLGGFGRSLAFVGGTLAVGAPGEGRGDGSGDGAVHLFDLGAGAWHETARLLPTLNGLDSDDFGSSLAASNDVLVVGSQLHGEEMDPRGAFYQFNRQGTAWTPVIAQEAEQKSSAYLGASIALSGQDILVGAPGATRGNVQSAGTVVRFTRK